MRDFEGKDFDYIAREKEYEELFNALNDVEYERFGEIVMEMLRRMTQSAFMFLLAAFTDAGSLLTQHEKEVIREFFDLDNKKLVRWTEQYEHLGPSEMQKKIIEGLRKLYDERIRLAELIPLETLRDLLHPPTRH